MSKDVLSIEEQLTLDSYERIAARRNAPKYTDAEYWRAEFEKFRTLLPSGRVIDLGCGNGRDAGLFIPGGYGYVGVDLSEAMLKLARASHPDADFRPMSLYRLEFPDACFDGFWAMTSLIHVPKRKIDLALGEIRRVVRPGGTGLISMFQGNGETVVQGRLEGDSRFFAEYGSEEMGRVLTRNGFDIIDRGTRAFQTSDGRNLTILLDYVRV